MARCNKKRMSKLNAKLALATMQRKDKGAKRIYYCAIHRGWHVTSKEKRKGL